MVESEPTTDAAQPEEASASRFVARWDLDKTYLRTDFDTARDLIRTALERPDHKRSVPGAAPLLRELGKTGARIHILSGSPRQMKSRLTEKLRIDGARWDELTLKPNLSNVLRLRFRALRDQLGYKLPLLLSARNRDVARAGAPLDEILLGDDAEADAFVYSLYADIVGGAVGRSQLARVLDAGRLYKDQIETCLNEYDGLERGESVGRILIHLERQSRPSRFDSYGRRLVPFYNYLQAAFVLAEDGMLEAPAVLRIAADFVQRHRFDSEALARSYADLMRRGHVRGAIHAPLAHAVEAPGRGSRRLAAAELRKMVDRIAEYVADAPAELPDRPPRADYLELAQKHRGGKNRKERRW